MSEGDVPGTPAGCELRGSVRGFLRTIVGLPWWLSAEEVACQCRRCGFSLSSRKISCTSEQLYPCATAPETVCQNPGAATSEACMLQSLCSAAKEAISSRALQLENSPHSSQLEKSPHRRPNTAKNE